MGVGHALPRPSGQTEGRSRRGPRYRLPSNDHAKQREYLCSPPALHADFALFKDAVDPRFRLAIRLLSRSHAAWEFGLFFDPVEFLFFELRFDIMAPPSP